MALEEHTETVVASLQSYGDYCLG